MAWCCAGAVCASCPSSRWPCGRHCRPGWGRARAAPSWGSMVDIAPPMAVLPIPEMSVNCVPSWFQLEIVWLIGDVTMPLTLPTAEQTFFWAYLMTASCAAERIEPRLGMEKDRSMI